MVHVFYFKEFTYKDKLLPMACLPMAHWYVFLGDWLWFGYGMSPAHTPRMVKGSISR